MAFKEGVILGIINLNLTGTANTSIGSTSNSGTIAIGNASLTNLNILGPTNINVGGTLSTGIGSTSNSGTISIGNAASTNVNLLGPVNVNVTGSTNTAINSTSSSGTVSIGNSASGAITITTGSAGNFSLVGNGHSVSIANDAAANTTILGSTNTTATTTINAGTTGLTLATGTTGPIAINPGTTGAVTLGTTSTGNVSVGNTTGTTSVQFGSGSALTTFKDWTSWTPTLDGSVSGTTTYTIQFGTYSRIGNMVLCQFQVACSAATGTGFLVIGGLPFTVNNTANYVPVGSVNINSSGLTWPVGATSITFTPTGGATTGHIITSGTAVAGSLISMANTTINVQGSVMYRI